MSKPFTKVLIANRSEVALRLQATCHARGMQTVAICSPEDRSAHFVHNASEAYCIARSGYTAYNAMDEIIAIALKSGADAVHPGYGFLSEKAVFAQKVIDAGLVWVGPRPKSIALMGDKVAARVTMQQSGVPVIPGFVIDDFSQQACDKAAENARAIGFPLMIKDPYGGGGKAMQKVDCSADFIPALHKVHQEAQQLTGSTSLLVEKYITGGRHIEVQIVGDGERYIHLFERECSLQRRHQKIIEETPCCFVPQPVLEQMYEAALFAARGVAYDSIGTVEFIVTPDNSFYFLEMNTRLQVEHAITEMTTGIDLVGLQLDLASGHDLMLQQCTITRQGCAIECRLYAENPAANFMPATGKIQHFFAPNFPSIRFEHALQQGTEITSLFDPMIAKAVAWAPTRQQCATRLESFLQQLQIQGVTTNRDFVCALLRSDVFASGAFHTQTIANRSFVQDILQQTPLTLNDREAVLAGIAYLCMQQQRKVRREYRVGQRGWKGQQWR